MNPWRPLVQLFAALERRHADAEVERKNRLSKALFLNNITALEGSISKMFKMAGHIINQHMTKCLADFSSFISEKIGDDFEELRKVTTNDFRLINSRNMEAIKELIEDNNDKQRVWMEQFYAERENIIKGYLEAYNAAAEQRQVEIIASIFGVYKFIESKDYNEADRYLALTEQVRKLAEANEREHSVNFGTYIGLHEHTVGSIGALREEIANYRRPRIIPTITPRLIADHADNIIDLGMAMNRLRENTIPPDQAKAAVIRAIRGLGDFSLREIDAALREPLETWGLAS